MPILQDKKILLTGLLSVLFIAWLLILGLAVMDGRLTADEAHTLARLDEEFQAERWGRDRLEQALALLIETDLSLRSSTRAPGMAVMERALIRLAMAKG